MLYDHLVFPGALGDIVDEFMMILSNQDSKKGTSAGIGKNVKTQWYGGGYISMIEESSYYYFNRANNLNYGYNINSVEAVRLEHYSKNGNYSVRKELNHFYQNYLDRKLIGIVNLNDGFNPNENGGKISLLEGDVHRTYVDDIFYMKKGSMVVFNAFTGYKIEDVLCDNLSYMFCFCVGDKWK